MPLLNGISDIWIMLELLYTRWAHTVTLGTILRQQSSFSDCFYLIKSLPLLPLFFTYLFLSHIPLSPFIVFSEDRSLYSVHHAKAPGRSNPPPPPHPYPPSCQSWLFPRQQTAGGQRTIHTVTVHQAGERERGREGESSACPERGKITGTYSRVR